MVGMLGFAGCGPDNESEGSKLATKAGDPGKPAEGSIPTEKQDPAEELTKSVQREGRKVRKTRSRRARNAPAK